jgi:aldehyde dehydrogenase (NAD+)
MKIEKIHSTLDAQQKFFKTGITKNITYRIDALNKLKNMIISNEKRLMDALFLDLHKSPFEAYASELGLILTEIDLHIKHVKRWTRTRRKPTPMVLFPSKSHILQEPYGLALIMAPFNYPLGLLLTPLVGAISAGNCVVLKPANYTIHTSALLEELISETFSNEYISIFTGGRDVNTALLRKQYDRIFFTGGPVLGKIVAESAAKTFTPLVLELGGKSPCIVDESANLKRAARRIVWGKFLNFGQTCIAPDHLFVHASVKNELLGLMKIEIERQFGNDQQKSPDLGRMINEKAFDRVSSYLDGAKVICGGIRDKTDKYISPTLIEAPAKNLPVMQEEIFGPVLPVIEFEDINEVIKDISLKEKPLALYYFTSKQKQERYLLSKIDSGGVCINDVLVHFANDRIPFGGVGKSGMGAYHGKYSFETFSRERGVVKTPTGFDIPVKFAPYKNKIKLLKRLL